MNKQLTYTEVVKIVNHEDYYFQVLDFVITNQNKDIDSFDLMMMRYQLSFGLYAEDIPTTFWSSFTEKLLKNFCLNDGAEYVVSNLIRDSKPSAQIRDAIERHTQTAEIVIPKEEKKRLIDEYFMRDENAEETDGSATDEDEEIKETVPRITVDSKEMKKYNSDYKKISGYLHQEQERLKMLHSKPKNAPNRRAIARTKVNINRAADELANLKRPEQLKIEAHSRLHVPDTRATFRRTFIEGDAEMFDALSDENNKNGQIETCLGDKDPMSYNDEEAKEYEQYLLAKKAEEEAKRLGNTNAKNEKVETECIGIKDLNKIIKKNNQPQISKMFNEKSKNEPKKASKYDTQEFKDLVKEMQKYEDEDIQNEDPLDESIDDQLINDLMNGMPLSEIQEEEDSSKATPGKIVKNDPTKKSISKLKEEKKTDIKNEPKEESKSVKKEEEKKDPQPTRRKIDLAIFDYNSAQNAEKHQINYFVYNANRRDREVVVEDYASLPNTLDGINEQPVDTRETVKIDTIHSNIDPNEQISLDRISYLTYNKKIDEEKQQDLENEIKNSIQFLLNNLKLPHPKIVEFFEPKLVIATPMNWDYTYELLSYIIGKQCAGLIIHPWSISEMRPSSLTNLIAEVIHDDLIITENMLMDDSRESREYWSKYLRVNFELQENVSVAVD